MSAKVLSNLESIGDMVGYLSGVSEGLNEDDYIEGLIKGAHEQATDIFDLAAAASAKAGAIPHVFEFGVAGVTKGQAKYPNPTAPEARLYVHEIVGKGGQQDIMYGFRPAINRNPQPTTKDTGVPSKYLRRLSRRKYVFANKAMVMEAGTAVTIKPKNGNFLFVPFYGNPPRDPRNNRGFMMSRGPITTVPGATTKGSFQAMWMGWWGSTGAQVMESEMGKTVGRDIEIAERQASSSAAAQQSLKPVQATNIKGTVASALRRGKSEFGRATRAMKNWRTR